MPDPPPSLSTANADGQDAAHTVLNGQEWNDFVGRRTHFSGWEEMLSTAGTEHLSQELFEGLA